MINELLISCIIPTHNRVSLLCEAINSILKQTLLPYEIIISDNLQDKATENAIKNLNVNSKVKIVYIGHDKGGKGCISRNIAAEQATGNYLAFLDDDDLWAHNYLENIAAKRLSVNKPCAIYSWLAYLYSGGIKKSGKHLVENLRPNKFILNNPGSVISNLTVDKDIYLKLNGFDENTHPPYDKDFIIRLMQEGYNYYVVPQELVFFRQHDEDRESSITKDFIAGQVKFYTKHKSWIPYVYKILIKIKLGYLRYITADSMFAKLNNFPYMIFYKVANYVK